MPLPESSRTDFLRYRFSFRPRAGNLAVGYTNAILGELSHCTSCRNFLTYALEKVCREIFMNGQKPLLLYAWPSDGALLLLETISTAIAY